MLRARGMVGPPIPHSGSVDISVWLTDWAAVLWPSIPPSWAT